MQQNPSAQDKRAPEGISPLNTDFRPGGEEEKWPEDPQTATFETENDPDALQQDPQSKPDEIADTEDGWEEVVRNYKIY